MDDFDNRINEDDDGLSRDNRLKKMEVDYAPICNTKLPECIEMAKEGDLTGALDVLMGLEKQVRIGADTHSCTRVLCTIVEICYTAKNWDLLCDYLALLTKKRGQIRQSVTEMIQKACAYVYEIKEEDAKMKYLNTLRNITEGKIYVEKEHARLTKYLSDIREKEGNISEAATLLQSLQVETYGSMEKEEKVEFLLEQMRLSLLNNDVVRTQVISKKVSSKFLEDKKFESLKLRFYELMIQADQRDEKYFNICRHFHAIYNTDTVKEDAVRKDFSFKNVIIYCILAKHDVERNDLLERLKLDKFAESLPSYLQLLKNFTAKELISWPNLCQGYEKELRAVPKATKALAVDSEEGKKNWELMKSRVVQHNIIVISGYYTAITLKRMAQLLNLTEKEAESYLAELVTDHLVVAKIDRLQGTVSFTKNSSHSTEDVMNEWSHNIGKLMQVINKTTHLINKEEMIHNVFSNVSDVGNA